MQWTQSCRKTCGATAYGQAVWSCPLDAGVKSVEMINRRRWLSSPIHRGERGVSRKAIAQGVPDRFGFTCGDYARLLSSICRRGCGCGQHPAFPAPSAFKGDNDRASPGRKRAAGMRSRGCLKIKSEDTASSIASPRTRGEAKRRATPLPSPRISAAATRAPRCRYPAWSAASSNHRADVRASGRSRARGRSRDRSW
jgi:hypothetical protein